MGEYVVVFLFPISHDRVFIRQPWHSVNPRPWFSYWLVVFTWASTVIKHKTYIKRRWINVTLVKNRSMWQHKTANIPRPPRPKPKGCRSTPCNRSVPAAQVHIISSCTEPFQVSLPVPGAWTKQCAKQKCSLSLALILPALCMNRGRWSIEPLTMWARTHVVNL